jgi:hypothetical protein
MLTLFMMIGTLMLVLAMRTRSTARAFADAVAGNGSREAQAHALLDEALMTLVRGSPSDPAAGGPTYESLLADRYGNDTLEGDLTQITQNGPRLQAMVTLAAAPPPLSLQGRIVTFKPHPDDPAPISSFRILAVNGNAWELANLRTVEIRPLPTMFPCRAIVNGREFSGTSPNEEWDGFDAANPFLTQVSAQGATVSVQRPAYAGADGAVPNLEVDNDGDGIADGVWLDDVLPESASGSTARVSYLVLDLCGRLNVNAHGSTAGNAGTGPAAVDGSAVLPDASVWPRLLSGGTSPAQPQPPAAGRRRSPPALGGALQGRFGGGPSDTYSLRLDFDGSRPASRQAANGNVFTHGELEAVLRPFDSDGKTLPPRLTALLGDSAEAVRMLVTTDSWDTCGLTGVAARSVVNLGDPATLPPESAEGLRFSLTRALTDDDDKDEFFADLLAVVVAAGVPNTQATAQWVANVIDFIDADSTPGQYKSADGATSAQGVEPSTIQKDGQPIFTNWNTGRLDSAGELLGIPLGTREEIDEAIENGIPVISLAAAQRVILDAVTVPSLYETTVFVDAGGRRFCRWREPGRVNVNTCNEDIWEAVVGQNIPNPFQGGTVAQSAANLLLDVPQVFTSPTRDAASLDRSLANRLANIGTARSDVFAVWITLELTPEGGDAEPEYHRLFAIVDRSIPVGHSPGRNLNVRDTIRVLRHLE